MPYAYVTSTGAIRTTCLKPVEALQAGETLVKYTLPEYDPELAVVRFVTPVVNGRIEFVAEPRPSALAVITKRKTEVIQDLLDTKASERGYDSILSAVSYCVDPTGPFYTEAVGFAKWRNLCWAEGLKILAKVEEGVMPVPTDSELVAMLPALTF